MYRIKTILKTGVARIEKYKTPQSVLDRFISLKNKKKIHSLDICIFLEKLVHKQSQEYRILRIG